jgi:hypothetical protein
MLVILRINAIQKLEYVLYVYTVVVVLFVALPIRLAILPDGISKLPVKNTKDTINIIVAPPRMKGGALTYLPMMNRRTDKPMKNAKVKSIIVSP